VTRAPIIRAWAGTADVIADNFAGGGGVSEGFKRALGRAPDHAINHDAEALAMHAVNHPETQHHEASVWDVDPSELIGRDRVLAAWFSPDCKDHSSAKGGKPIRKREIRTLAWVAVRWAAAVKPKWIFLENVPEFRDWGPTHQQHSDGCEPHLELDEDGDEVIVCCMPDDARCRFGQRIASRKGQIFRAFERRLRTMYRNVEHRIMRCSDYGSPTSRKRFFLIASDEPIRWPTPSHGAPNLIGLKPYRTAAECIDFSIPCPSIFLTREEAREYGQRTGVQIKRPLADATLQRIAAGIDRYVLKAARPFIVPVAHGAKGERDRRCNSVDDPIGTITADRRGDFALVAPTLVQTGQGERDGQRPRYLDLHAPLGTVVACGGRHALVSAFLANNNSVRASGGWNIGHGADEPMSTITGQRQKSLVAASLVKLRGTSSAAPIDAPLPTVSAGGWHMAQVAAFLVRYNGTSGPQSLADPLSTIDTTDRHGLVTIWIDGACYVIADIGFRMLEPRELARATGFADSYVLDPIVDGAPLTRTAQIRMIGNAVPPDVVEALVRANLIGEAA
jgi:DNA (cytosine-5)-methyltransferase 1